MAKIFVCVGRFFKREEGIAPLPLIIERGRCATVRRLPNIDVTIFQTDPPLAKLNAFLKVFGLTRKSKHVSLDIGVATRGREPSPYSG